MPDMEKDEVMLIKVYDSKSDVAAKRKLNPSLADVWVP